MKYDRDLTIKLGKEMEQDAMANNRFRGLEPKPDLVHVYQTPDGKYAAAVVGIISDGFSSELHAWKWAAQRAAHDACLMNEMLEEALSNGN